MALVRLVTYDGFEVPLTEAFVRRHLDNGVFPRLLGWKAEDGLTTPEPSLDSEGRHTILAKLGVAHRPFLGLLRFLRSGMHSVSPDRLEEIMDTSLCIGGIEALDQALRESLKGAAPAAPAGAPPDYNPLTPAEDTLNVFRWATIHMSHSSEMVEMASSGWSVTKGMNDYILFVRKPAAD